MKNSKFSDEKINQYGKIGLYVLLIVLTCVGAFCVIYQAYNWEIGKNDFTNWIIACGTIASAVGLIWFSYLTYKNQQNNEFQSLFNILLNEHNRLLGSIDQKELREANKEIIKKIYSCNNDQKEFEEKVSEIIDRYINFKPYLITLFRLLKLIKLSKKICDNNDKREYYGLVRALIPAEVLFLILFNSLRFGKDKKDPNYADLLIEARLFEHLPITGRWLRDLYVDSNDNPIKIKIHIFHSDSLVNYMFSYDDKFFKDKGKFTDKDEPIDERPLGAFGKSIYLGA